MLIFHMGGRDPQISAILTCCLTRVREQDAGITLSDTLPFLTSVVHNVDLLTLVCRFTDLKRNPKDYPRTTPSMLTMLLLLSIHKRAANSFMQSPGELSEWKALWLSKPPNL